MDKAKQFSVFCLLLAALFLCWAGALYWGQWLSNNFDGAGARLKTSGITQAQIAQALTANTDENILDIAAWRREDALVQIENPLLYAEYAARRVAAWGDPRKVCPMTVLSGGFPVQSDSSGCVIEERAAMALYHNLDVVGANLMVDGKTYVVRGVVRAKEALLLVRDPKTEYTSFTFSTKNVSNAGASAEGFLLRLGISSEEYVLVENGLFGAMTASLSGLPGFIALVCVLLPLLRAGWLRRYSLACVPLFLGGVLLFFLLAWLLDLRLFWPEAFLPAQWSDFAFWPNLWKTQAANFEAISYLTPNSKDLQWMSAMRRCSLYSLLSCGFFAALLRTNPAFPLPWQNKTAPLLLPLGAAVVFGIFLLLGLGFSPTRGYFFALPVWWAARHGAAVVQAQMARQLPAPIS